MPWIIPCNYMVILHYFFVNVKLRNLRSVYFQKISSYEINMLFLFLIDEIKYIICYNSKDCVILDRGRY
jgi:hypothetical protein